MEALELESNIKTTWSSMNGNKGSILRRCEEYADWTIPHIFPRDEEGDREQQQAMNATGAEVVNHLANKVAETLFPQEPFFRVSVEGTAYDEAIESGVDETQIDDALINGENKAMRFLDKKGLRVAASDGAKHLLITGNFLFYMNEEEKPIVIYDLRDDCVQRDGSGRPICVITRDSKEWGQLEDDIQKMVIKTDKIKKRREDKDKVELFTKVMYDYKTGRAKVQQGLDELDMPEDGDYPIAECPWVPVVWHRNRRDDYGRGLVEDYAGDFHALNVLTEAQVKGLALMADIKHMVRPGSGVDLEELTNSDTGSYHYANEGDLWTPELRKAGDFATVANAIEVYQRRLGRAFLMNSATTRDAERVTAHEIQVQANELNSSKGGVYSHLADTWQKFVAAIALSKQDLGNVKGLETQIITGLDSLTRANDTTQFRWLIEDAAAMNQVPEPMQKQLNTNKLWRYLGNNRGVDYSKFLFTEDEVKANDERAAAAQQRALAAEQQGQTAGQIAIDANKGE
jgi:hypothetical protein